MNHLVSPHALYDSSRQPAGSCPQEESRGLGNNTDELVERRAVSDNLTKFGQAGGQGAADATLPPGILINDKYKVLSLIGKGGMGSVYRVQQLVLGKDFALKLLDLHNLSDVTIRRFHQEARMAAQLRHPNLVEVHDFGLVNEMQPYLVMDLVEGQTLAQLLKKRTTLPVGYVVKLAVQIGFGLLSAHERGVVHRDIKPGNIIVLHQGESVTEGSVKIVDFGIAKLVQSEEGEIQELTKTGEIFGSPVYMSPEQCMGAQVDQRCDIYSLGCVIYECLTGGPPFVAENAMSTMMMRLSQEPQSLKQASLGREFPPLLESVVQKMLALDPKDRYQDLAAVINDLMRVEKNEQDVVVSGPKAKITWKAKLAQFPVETAMLLIAGAILGGLAVHLLDRFVLLRTNPSSLAPSPVSEIEPIPSKDVRMITSDTMNEAITPSTNVQSPTVSIVDGQQVLHFPKKVASVEINYQKVLDHYDNIPVPAGAHVSLNIDLPGYLANKLSLRKLSDVNLELICYRYAPSIDTSGIAGLAGLKHLEGLDLNRSSVNSLSVVKHATSLKVLRVAETPITASELLSLTCLKDLRELAFGGVEDATPVFRKLSETKKIETLHYEGNQLNKSWSGSGLTPESLTALSQLANLKHLQILDCPELTNESLKKLLPLKRLETLQIQNCSVTADALPTLQSFKDLTALTISQDGWTVKQKVGFAKQLAPRCTVSIPDPKDAKKSELLNKVKGFLREE